MELFNAAGKAVRFFSARQSDAPLVLLHTFQDEGERVYRKVLATSDADFSFAAVGNLDWDADMSPWAIPPIAKDDTPCSGGADDYLQKLTDDILPEILRRISSKPRYIALAGYSLAGLFAVYAIYKTELFARIASASGSFWYPDFLAYAQKTKTKRQPECVYFSLGDKEAKTKNKILRSVEENTRRLKDFYEAAGIETVFEMNSGNHFQHADERMAKGIVWILRQDNL